MIQQTAQADEFKKQLRDSFSARPTIASPSRLRDMKMSMPLVIKMKWSILSRMGRSNSSWFPRKVKSAYLRSIVTAIFLVSCA